MRRMVVGVVSSAVVSGCVVNAVDRTSTPLVYNSPLNTQVVEVDVSSNVRVSGVTANTPDGISVPLALNSEGNYEGTLRYDACSELAEFSIGVRVPAIGGTSTRRLPRAGNFTHRILDRPGQCAPFDSTNQLVFEARSIEDFVDSNPGDGKCEGIRPNGEIGCSLRAAVMEANAKPGSDLIRLQAIRYQLTLSGLETPTQIVDTVGDLDISESVTIERVPVREIALDRIVRVSNTRGTNYTDRPGDVATIPKIDAGGLSRVFHVVGGDTVLRLRNLVVLGGMAEGAGDGLVTGEASGGGILNFATTSLERVVIMNNAATSITGGASGGGGIFNDGVLIGRDVAFLRNTVSGFNNTGGGLYNRDTVYLQRALFAYNQSRFGSAIENSNASMRIVNTTLFDNGDENTRSVVRNSGRGKLRVSFSTFTNHRTRGRGRYHLHNTILAGTTSLNSTLMVNSGQTDEFCGGNITSAGGNVIQGACRLIGDPLSPDFTGVGQIQQSGDSRQYLSQNGGFLPVLPLIHESSSSISSAVDKGVLLGAPITDQRGPGFPRPLDGVGDGISIPDSGAFEYEP